MATNIGMPRRPARIRLGAVPIPHVTGPTWGAIGVTALLIGITCWWLTQDRSVPIYDAGLHLSLVQDIRSELASGHLLKALTMSTPYPPFAYLIGAAGLTLGGISVASPIIAENVFFVTLLALGCYKLGQRAFGAIGGLLAVIFALGSPLIIAQFHVFMVDAPETAMVAVSVWAIVATDGFSRLGVSAAAGLAVGLGMLTKEPFAFFVAGVIVVTVVRGGWRAWRGVLVFAAIASVIALPWYIYEYSLVHSLGTGAVKAANNSGLGADIAPARFSIDNLTWYLWNFINSQLLVPLLLFVVVGAMWVGFRSIIRRPVGKYIPELVLGGFVSWFAITETFAHDTRYSMPMLVYLAVLGGGWIARLGFRGRTLGATALVLVAVANTLGTSFGVGRVLSVELPGATLSSRQRPGLLTFYSNEGFLVSGPRRGGDILPTLRALRRNGVRRVILPDRSLVESDFSAAGVEALTRIAGLEVEAGYNAPLATLTRRDAVLAHGAIGSSEPPPCVRLSDGTGVWIRLGNPVARGARDYCPSRHPPYYGP